jgi:hypothetical protein
MMTPYCYMNTYIQVERCSFCVEYGSNIKTISDTLLFKQVYAYTHTAH